MPTQSLRLYQFGDGIYAVAESAEKAREEVLKCCNGTPLHASIAEMIFKEKPSIKEIPCAHIS